MFMYLGFNVSKISSEICIYNKCKKEQKTGDDDDDEVERETVGSRRHILFTLDAERLDYIEFKTGKIFQSKKRAKYKKQEDKNVSAQLKVIEELGDLDTDKLRELNSLRYHDTIMAAYYFVGEREFSAICSSINSGQILRRVVLHVDDDALEFGSEYDGSGIKWDNEKKNIISVQSLYFDFYHFGADEDDEYEYEDNLQFIGETSKSLSDTRASYSDLAKVSYVVIQKLNSLQKQITTITWIMVLIGLVIWWVNL